jgi:predicted RNA-binding protein (virulence factor B family)
MIELGKTQCLNIVKVTDFGVYLGTEEDKVLLPKKQVPDDVEVGDALTVFVYRDSSDRLIATTNKPKIQLGELKRLKVSQVTGIGAFLTGDLKKTCSCHTRNRQHMYQKAQSILLLSI